LEEGDHLQEQLRLLYVSLTRAKKALVLSRPAKIKRGKVAALGLQQRGAGTKYYQALRQCRFFDQLAHDSLPISVKGADWEGIQIEALPDED
jgi:ATP-dependent exoDNAse (exonuclease V) beta subunit